MFDQINSLYVKYRHIIMYTIFGGVTTVANISFYYLCYNIFNIPNVSSTILAWVIAVGFAFITNKIWVFDSKKFDDVVVK